MELGHGMRSRAHVSPLPAKPRQGQIARRRCFATHPLPESVSSQKLSLNLTRNTAQVCELLIHLPPRHTSEESLVGICWWKRPVLADEMQFGVEDRRSSRHRCRHYSVRGSRRTTYGNSLPTLLWSFGRHPSPCRFSGWPATRSPSGRRVAEREGLALFGRPRPLDYKFILRFQGFLSGRCYTEMLHHAPVKNADPH